MNTPSHFIMTAAAAKFKPQWRVVRSAALLGSVAPDIPLYVISLAAYVYFHHFQGWTQGDAFRHMYGTLYFEHPAWIGPHNLLHSPVVLIPVLLSLRWTETKRPKITQWFRWFFLACLLHSFVDIATHYDDGPVLLWPISWTLRFYSPISYWDSNHFGREFAMFEVVFDLALLAYLIVPWIWRRMAHRDGESKAASGGEV